VGIKLRWSAARMGCVNSARPAGTPGAKVAQETVEVPQQQQQQQQEQQPPPPPPPPPPAPAPTAAAAAAAVPDVAAYVSSMNAQLQKALANPDKILDIAASKRSPFKFQRGDHDGKVDVNMGISAVALPDEDSDFGKRYIGTVDKIEDLFNEYMESASKRQTIAHMSIGAVLLDKKSPQEYNDAIGQRPGFIASVKAKLDELSATPPRAKIQTLKINPDGCVTFQLDHDPAQDVTMEESELREALGKIPTCQGDALPDELRKFSKGADGKYQVSRFQQVRLALGGLGCEIKGMWPSGHMVVSNLVDPKVIAEIPQEKKDELWEKCHAAWTPLIGKWFDLHRIVCLCYVERSLNEGSVVLAPVPGKEPMAFPETNPSAQALLGGIFHSNEHGDVLIHVENFKARCDDKATNMWLAFEGEARESLSTPEGNHLHKAKKFGGDQLLAAFKVYDEDGSGSISTAELKDVMLHLGERLSDAELAAMVKVADTDGSGQIEYVEFVNLMHAGSQKRDPKVEETAGKGDAGAKQGWWCSCGGAAQG